MLPGTHAAHSSILGKSTAMITPINLIMLIIDFTEIIVILPRNSMLPRTHAAHSTTLVDNSCKT